MHPALLVVRLEWMRGYSGPEDFLAVTLAWVRCCRACLRTLRACSVDNACILQRPDIQCGLHLLERPQELASP